jgi:hypothetical protein
MHRTQIYLEEAQYEMLRAQAQRAGKSLAALIREILDRHLRRGATPTPTPDPLDGIVGIAEGDGSAVAENHAEYLYGDLS